MDALDARLASVEARIDQTEGRLAAAEDELAILRILGSYSPRVDSGDAEGVAAVDATIPMGRMAEPADVGRAAAFLASPLAAYITGAELLVHGGGEKPAFLSASTAENKH